MNLHITHTTRYDYVPDVEQAWHMACLRPRATPTQKVASHSLALTPGNVRTHEQLDAFGNSQVFFSIHSAHAGLRVDAVSTVSTLSPGQLGQACAQQSWEAVRERFRYRSGAPFDAAAEYRFASPYIEPNDAFADYAWQSFKPNRPLAEACVDLMQRIHTDFVYLPASTDVSTTPLQALAAKTGVCQDFAHVLVACLRTQGLSSRYVSGYLLTEPPPGKPRLIGADASHAWASVYVPSADSAALAGVWLDLDPTNNRSGVHSPGADYVTLAWGRDYADVSPLRGVLHGGARHEPHVAVTVMPL